MVPVSTKTNWSDSGGEEADPVGRQSGLTAKAGPSQNGDDEVRTYPSALFPIHAYI